MGTHCNDGAAAPELVTPTSDRADGANVGRVGAGQGSESPDCAALDADRKAFTRMTAHAAQAGCALHELAGGGYLLCKWGMAKELPRLRAVGDLIRQIGGAA